MFYGALPSETLPARFWLTLLLRAGGDLFRSTGSFHQMQLIKI